MLAQVNVNSLVLYVLIVLLSAIKQILISNLFNSSINKNIFYLSYKTLGSITFNSRS